MLIFKICHAAEWKTAECEGIYAGSAKDREDHFIHFSTAEQVMGTLERYYAGAGSYFSIGPSGFGSTATSTRSPALA